MVYTRAMRLVLVSAGVLCAAALIGGFVFVAQKHTDPVEIHKKPEVKAETTNNEVSKLDQMLAESKETTPPNNQSNQTNPPPATYQPQTYTPGTYTPNIPPQPKPEPYKMADDLCQSMAKTAADIAENQLKTIQYNWQAEKTALARSYGQRGIPLSSQMYLNEVAGIDAKYAGQPDAVVANYHNKITSLQAQGCNVQPLI